MSVTDRGSAPVEFTLVGIVLTVLFAGLLQFGFDLHVRNVLAACASEGARYGANADRSPADGAVRARSLVASALSARYAQDVTADVDSTGAVPVVVVTVHAPLPVFGPLGIGGDLVVRGHALKEGAG
jgi:Flp pilus assembly protein TadG